MPNLTETNRPRVWHTEEQEAARLGFKHRTLRLWRASKKGPPFMLINGSIRYNPDAVDAWVLAQNVQPEGDQDEKSAASR
jgi:hypothetical protein